MFLTVHAITGLVLTQSTQNPLTAFAIGFGSHFIMDAIPHGDNELSEQAKRSGSVRVIVKWATGDLILMHLLLAVLWWLHWIPFNLATLAAAYGAVLPDAIQIPSIVFKPPPKFLRGYQRFHVFVHNLTGLRVNLKQGLIIQGITLALLLALLVK